MMRTFLALAVLSLLLTGCVGSSSADQRARAEDFNEAAVEKAMKDSGKEKELEEARKREAEYLRNSNSGPTSQDGTPTQDGPSNAGNQ